MSHRLPDYLRMKTDASPDRDRVFVWGGVRFTVITPQLIRIEQGCFTDEATLTVLCRRITDTPCETCTQDGCFHLLTSSLALAYDPGKSLEQGLTVRHLGEPAFLWHYGDRALRNLGGTAATLDGCDGACDILEGVCAVDGFAVLDDSTTPLMLPDGWFAPRKAGTDVYFFGYGHQYTRCVQDYCRLTGRVRMLPAFALGNWWSRYCAYSQQEYLALMDRFVEEDVPLSTAIVDMDWHITAGEGRPYRSDGLHDGWTGYTWNKSLFPDGRSFLRELHARGLRTALNLHPAAGVRAHECQYESMARAMGMDADKKETVRFNCLDARFLKAYFEILHFPYEADGVDFWWLDWQQGSDYRSFAGEPDASCAPEAIPPLWMLNHMHTLASRRSGKRGMIFSRYAGYGSQRYPIGFSGDTFVTWESLRFQPYFTATASNIGFGWWSHDIGGHMGGIRDDELAVRWVQFGVFSPVFRLHSSNSVFNRREPWTYNPRSERIMKAFMRLRHQLFPYIYTMNARCETEQIPLILPMYHTHPETPEAYAAPNQYWFGSEMIAAPITEPADGSGMASAKVFFPDGLWTDLFTGTVYRGRQTIHACRPLEQMPVFLKAGAIVPMQAHVPGSRRLGGAERMELYVAPGASNRLVLWEDDGETLGYQQGLVSLTEIRFSWSEKQAELSIKVLQDRAHMIPAARSWEIHLIGFSDRCAVSVDGRAAESPAGAGYDETRNAYTVHAGGSDAVRIRISCETGLVSRNASAYGRCIDLLTRAQMPLAAKTQLKEKLDRAAARMAGGLPVHANHFGSDQYRTVGLAMFELMTQSHCSLCEQ